MLPILPLATTAIGLIQANGEAIEKKKQDAALQRTLNGMPTYQVAKSAKTLLSSTRSRLNSLSPGVLAATNMLNQGVTNQMGNAQRNASSGAQALSVGSAAQSNAISALPGLATQQDEYERRREAEYDDALKNMSAEERAAFQSQQDKQATIANYQLGRVGASNANTSQGLNLAAMGLSLLGGGGVGGAAAGGATGGGLNLAAMFAKKTTRQPGTELEQVFPRPAAQSFPVPSGWYGSYMAK